MKKIISFILFLAVNIKFYTNNIVNEPRWVRADVGLNMRENPDINSKIIQVIPDEEMVILLEETGENVSISGETGRWSKIEWRGKTGWVFGGFISNDNPKIFEAMFFLDYDTQLCLRYKPTKIIINSSQSNVFNPKEESIIKNEYIYNNSNKIIKYIKKYDSKVDNKIETYEFEYNNKEQLKKINWVINCDDNSNKFFALISYENNLIKKIEEFSENGLQCYNVYNYDKKYKLIELIQNDAIFILEDNNIEKPSNNFNEMKIIYEYNNEGKLIKTKRSDEDTAITNYNPDNSYDVSISGNVKGLIKYNSKGLMINFNAKLANGDGCYSKGNIIYDNKNRIIKIEMEQKLEGKYEKIKKEFIY